MYRMWDPETKRVRVSRDIAWLERICFENKSPHENYASRNLLTNEAREVEIPSTISRNSTGNQTENENIDQNGSNKNTDSSEIMKTC